MSGIHSHTGVLLARQGLAAAIRAALADEERVDIYDGFHWPIRHNDSMQLTSATSNADPKTVGPRRAYDETITLGVTVTSWRAGSNTDPAVAVAAFDRAFELLAKVTDYVMDGDNTELGGAVQWCLPGAVDSDGEEYDDGFQVEIAAEFVCSHRVRAN